MLLFAAWAGCGDAPLLSLKVVLPEGTDPLAGVDQLRLVVSHPSASSTIKVTDPGSFSLELEVEVEGDVGRIILEGLAGGRLVARGETPPMVLTSEKREMALLVARSGALSQLRPRLPSAATDLTSVVLPGMGILLAGGRDGSGRYLTEASLYDFFQHTLSSVQALPTARAGAVAVYCGSSCATVALGEEAPGKLATRILGFDGTRWTARDDGLDAATRRQNAGIALMGLQASTYLVAGGSGVSASLDTLLQLDPGSDIRDPSLKVLAGRARAARDRPAMAPATGAVVIAGGQAAGQPACEVFFTASQSSQSLTLPGPVLARGAAAVDLADGKVAIIGGQDSSGTLLQDAWIVDATTLVATHVSPALAAGRSGHRAVRVGSYLVVLGGTVASGPAGKGELVDARSLRSIAEIPTPSSRPHPVVQYLGPGSLLVAGGSTTMDVYEGTELSL